MKRTTSSIALACSFVLAAFAPAAAQAGPYSAIYAFGDSLSDVGNVLAATASVGAPQPVAPYVDGQFSNGSVWLQTLAAQAGLAPLTASLLGGTNYAYGGASTGQTDLHDANVTDLWGATGQIAQYQAAHASADPNALYTIWIGGNDLFDIAASAGTTTTAQQVKAAAQAIANIDQSIGALAAGGARNFLLVTVTDIGLTPLVASQGADASSFASQAAAMFNTALVGGNSLLGIPSLASIAGAGHLNLKVLDSYALLDKAVASPAAFGLTDVSTPCFTGSEDGSTAGTLCSTSLAEQNKHLFWDSIHPTAGVHEIIGEQAAAALAVPEPATQALLLMGLGALGLAARRRGR